MIELNGTKFFNKEEVCERLQMNLYTLNNKVCQQKIKGTRFGRKVHYTEADMLDIVDPGGALYRALVSAARAADTEGPAADDAEPTEEAPAEDIQAQEEPKPKKKPRKSKPAAKATKRQAARAAQEWGAIVNDNWGVSDDATDWGCPDAPGWQEEDTSND